MDLALWISKVYFVTCLLLRFRGKYLGLCLNVKKNYELNLSRNHLESDLTGKYNVLVLGVPIAFLKVFFFINLIDFNIRYSSE